MTKIVLQLDILLKIERKTFKRIYKYILSPSIWRASKVQQSGFSRSFRNRGLV